MYLSFFIKPETEVLAEIKSVLKFAGFEDIKSKGVREKYRIVIFNGRETNNFSYTAHKLIKKVDFNNPFLVRAGSKWTLHGLVQILFNYAQFRIHLLGVIHFPKDSDFNKSASSQDFINGLKGMKKALDHCEQTSQTQVKEFREIIEGIYQSPKSIGEVKREILYFLIENRLNLPWGNPPTSKESKDLLIEWLRLADRSFPRERSTYSQHKKDLKKIKKLEDTKKLELI